jgi:hypothetical protein
MVRCGRPKKGHLKTVRRKRGTAMLRKWWQSQKTAMRKVYIGGMFSLASIAMGGLTTIVVAEISAHADSENAVSSAPAPSPSQLYRPVPPPVSTPSSTPSLLMSPSPTAGVAQGSAFPVPAQVIPILSPVAQAGWVLEWNRVVQIGAPGVILATSGPQPGDGTSFDLQYIDEPGNGWSKGLDPCALMYWRSVYKPGPASINGIVNYSRYLGAYPAGAQAVVGDRLIFEDSARNVVAYMQVTDVSGGYVDVDTWVWAKSQD